MAEAFCQIATGRCHYHCEKLCGFLADCRRNITDSGDVRLECFCPDGLTGDPNKGCQFALIEDLRDQTVGSLLSIQEFASTVHDFSQNMLVQLWKGSGNVVFSPFSLHTTLAMLTSGATDGSATQTELLSALGRFPNIQGLERQYTKLLTDYSNDPDHPMSFGNKMWTRRQFFNEIRGKFFERLDSIYRADIEILSDTDPAEQINRWVGQVTKGKINHLLDSVSSDTVLMLTNALHFKANWDFAFYPLDEIRDGESSLFRLADGSSVDANMMTRTSSSFHATKNFTFQDILPNVLFQAVSIPYEYESGRFEMLVCMPSVDPRGLNFLGASLGRQVGGEVSSQANIFDKIIDELEQSKREAAALEFYDQPEIELILPQFTVQSELDVVKHLKKMGVMSAFDVGEFDEISEAGNLKVTDVKHKAVVEVTKEGTEGAAVTSIEVAALIGAFEPPQVFKVDKPFLFMVHDTIEKSFLFLGKVDMPI